MLDLDEPLNRLADVDGRKSRIADLWFLDGLSLEASAHVPDLSAVAVKRD